jgi:hypothetical protein
MQMGLFRDLRTTLYGLISWAVPFLAAFLFFNPQGQLVVAQPLFKSIMVVVGGAVGVGLFYLLYRRHGPNAITGLAVGIYWLILNWVLDIAILLPMSGQNLPDYFADIGLRYLLLPMITWGMSAAAEVD